MSKTPKETSPLPPLTPDNYYGPLNTAISNSKVSDFFKSREYYFKKHIAKTLPRKETRNMKIGSMVDDILSQGTPQYQIKCLKRDDPVRFEMQKDMDEELLVTQDMWDEAEKRSAAVMREPAYKWYLENNATFQVPMRTIHKTEGIEVPVCGLADVITETPDAVYIDDFKSVAALKVSSPIKWWYNCQEMGYFRQLAAYQWLWYETHPNEKRPVICRHLLSAKMDVELYKTFVFVLPQDVLNIALVQFLDGVAGIVRAMQDNAWDDPAVAWEGATLLVPPNMKEEPVVADDGDEDDE